MIYIFRIFGSILNIVMEINNNLNLLKWIFFILRIECVKILQFYNEFSVFCWEQNFPQAFLSVLGSFIWNKWTLF